MALPIQTPEQLQESLRKAHEARTARSAALADVKKGAVTLPEVLADGESPLQRAFVRQLLQALPGIGQVRTRQAMERIGIAESRRVRGLGAKQRAALAEEFGPAGG